MEKWSQNDEKPRQVERLVTHRGGVCLRGSMVREWVCQSADTPPTKKRWRQRSRRRERDSKVDGGMGRGSESASEHTHTQFIMSPRIWPWHAWLTYSRSRALNWILMEGREEEGERGEQVSLFSYCCLFRFVQVTVCVLCVLRVNEFTSSLSKRL